MSSVKTRTSGFIRHAMSISTIPSTPPAALIASRGWNRSSAHASRSSAARVLEPLGGLLDPHLLLLEDGQDGLVDGCGGSRSAITRHLPPT